jgi:molybdenum cofactor biosynthesis enzyme MoaA
MGKLARSSTLRRRRIRSVIASGAGKLRRVRNLWSTPPLIEYIAADIVNNCNLRCPFCLVDYDQVKHTQLMDEKTFRALIRLAPAVPVGGFWLSCLHEPTLHPRLDEYLSWIPSDQRRKFWFTTNLARPLPDKLIASLARSGLHHINVSLDSFDEQLFAILRKHGRVSVFRNNLDRLVAEFRKTPGAPALRYITMAFRSNQKEIPGLVQWMNESGMAWEIEIRHTFNTSNIAEDFRRAHYMNDEEWEELRESLEALPYRNYTLALPPPDYSEQAPEMPANWFEMVKVNAPPPPTFVRPLQLRARPDGRLHLSGQEHVFTANVAEIEDPVRYFEDLCGTAAAARRHAIGG